MTLERPFRRFLGAVLALTMAYLSAAVPLAEAGFWEDRRRSITSSPQASLSGILPLGERVLNGFAPAEPPLARRTTGQKVIPAWMAGLATPFAQVEDFRLAPASGAAQPLVLLLQDIHGHTEAQQNVSKLLSEIDARYDLRLVGLEAAEGPFDHGVFRKESSREHMSFAADFLLKNRLIGGAEHFAFTNPREPFLWGVEKTSSYLSNVEAYRNTVPLQGAVKEYEGRLAAVLAEVKSKVFSPELKALDQKAVAYAAGTLGLGEYLEALSSVPGVRKDRYPETRTFLKAYALEKSIDFTQAQSERTRLVEALSKSLTARDLDTLVAFSLEFRSGRVSFGDYHSHLKALTQRHGLNLGAMPALSAYIEYALASDRIKKDGLFEEISALEREAGDVLAVTAEQREAVSLARDARLLGNLFHQRMTPQDWALWQSRRSAAVRLNDRISGFGLALPSLSFPADPAVYEGFYVHAFGRNADLLKNLLAAARGAAPVRTDRPAVVALVSGGFHTAGLRDLLVSQNISFAVLTPHLTSIDANTSNLEVFSRGHTPLEQMVLGRAVFLESQRPGAANPAPGHDTPRKAATGALLLTLIGLGAAASMGRGEEYTRDQAAATAPAAQAASGLSVSKTSALPGNRGVSVRFKTPNNGAIEERIVKGGTPDPKATLAFAAPGAAVSASPVPAGRFTLTTGATREWTRENPVAAIFGGFFLLAVSTGGIIVLAGASLTIGTMFLWVLAALAGVMGVASIIAGLVLSLGDKSSREMRSQALDLASSWGVSWWYEYPKLAVGLVALFGMNLEPLQEFVEVEHGIYQSRAQRLARWIGVGTVVLATLGVFVYVMGLLFSLTAGASSVPGAEMDVFGIPVLSLVTSLVVAPLAQHLFANLVLLPLGASLTTSGNPDEEKAEVAKWADKLSLQPGDTAYLQGLYHQRLNPRPGAKLSIGGNFIPSAMLSAEARRDALGAVEYADLVRDLRNAEAAKNVRLTLNPMNGGIGTSVERKAYLKSIWGDLGRSGDIILGAKGSDLYFDFTAEGKTTKVSVSEAKILRALQDASSYAGLTLQELASSDTIESVNLLYDTPNVYSRLGLSSAWGDKTYRQILADVKDIDLGQTLVQAALPTILRGDHTLTDARVAPGGHGQWGVTLLMNALGLDLEETNEDVITAIYNADGINNTVDPAISGWMARESVPVAMISTTKTSLDKKGGQIGLFQMEGGKTRTNMMELAQADDVGQGPLFIEMGLTQGQPGAQYFNTNTALVNYSVLTPLLKDLVSVIGIDRFVEVISPSLTPNMKRQRDADGEFREYVQLEGALGSSLLNLDAFLSVTDDPAIQAVMKKHGIIKLLRLINVDTDDRTLFFTPIKNAFDYWVQFHSDLFQMNTQTWILETRRPGFLPSVTLADKNKYYEDVANVLASFGKASTVGLDSLEIQGTVLLKDAVLKGNVKIQNDSDTPVNLNDMRYRASLPLLGDRLLLEDLSLSIDQEGKLTVTSLEPRRTAPLSLEKVQALAQRTSPFLFDEEDRRPSPDYSVSSHIAARLVQDQHRGAANDKGKKAAKKAKDRSDVAAETYLEEEIVASGHPAVLHSIEGSIDGVSDKVAGTRLNPQGKDRTLHILVDPLENTNAAAVGKPGAIIPVADMVNPAHQEHVGYFHDTYAGQIFTRVPEGRETAVLQILERLIDDEDEAGVLEGLQAVADVNGITVGDLEVTLLNRPSESVRLTSLREIQKSFPGLRILLIEDGTVEHALAATLKPSAKDAKHKVLWTVGKSTEGMINLFAAGQVPGALGALKLYSLSARKNGNGKDATSLVNRFKFSREQVRRILVEQVKGLTESELNHLYKLVGVPLAALRQEDVDFLSHPRFRRALDILAGKFVFTTDNMRGPVEVSVAFLTRSEVLKVPGVEDLGDGRFRTHTLRMRPDGKVSLVVEDVIPVDARRDETGLLVVDGVSVPKRSSLRKFLEDGGLKEISDKITNYDFYVTRRNQDILLRGSDYETRYFRLKRGDVLHVMPWTGSRRTIRPRLPSLVRAAREVVAEAIEAELPSAPTAAEFFMPQDTASQLVDTVVAAAGAAAGPSLMTEYHDLDPVASVPEVEGRAVLALLPELEPLLPFLGIPEIIQKLRSLEWDFFERRETLKWYAFFTGLTLSEADMAVLKQVNPRFEAAERLRVLMAEFRASATSPLEPVRAEAGTQYGAQVARLLEVATASLEEGRQRTAFVAGLRTLMGAVLVERERFSGEVSGEIHKEAVMTLLEATSAWSGTVHQGFSHRPAAWEGSGVPTVNVMSVGPELKDKAAFQNFVNAVASSASRDEAIFFTLSPGMNRRDAVEHLERAQARVREVLNGGIEDQVIGLDSVKEMTSRLVTTMEHQNLLTPLGLYDAGNFYNLLPELYPKLDGVRYNVLFSDTDLSRWDRSTLPASLRDRVIFVLLDFFKGVSQEVEAYSEKQMKAVELLKYQA